MPKVRSFYLVPSLTAIAALFYIIPLSHSAYADSFYQSSHEYPPGFHMSHRHDPRDKKYTVNHRTTYRKTHHDYYRFAPSYGPYGHFHKDHYGHTHYYKHTHRWHHYPPRRTGINIYFGR